MILQRGLVIFCRQNAKIWKKSNVTKHNSTHFEFHRPSVYIASFSTSISHGKKFDKKKNKKDLLPYKVLSENDEGCTDYGDKFKTLLNPAKHAEIIDAQKIGQNPAPSNAKYLKVSVVGIPNAGKSTLVNQLIGSNICPHSQKVHTTRENSLGILTKNSTQIVFEVSMNVLFGSGCEKRTIEMRQICFHRFKTLNFFNFRIPQG